MKTHIIKDGIVINTIIASPEEAEHAFSDALCVEATDGGIGWSYVDGKFVDLRPIPEPAPAPPPPTKEELLAQLQALQDQIIALGE
jgi:hypothetical protein